MFEFNNVSFSYKDVKEQALVDLNFSIKKGSLTLITGSSGSGKSTLLKLMNGLIPRLYDGKLVGEILFENNSLQSLTQESISTISCCVLFTTEVGLQGGSLLDTSTFDFHISLRKAKS